MTKMCIGSFKSKQHKYTMDPGSQQSETNIRWKIIFAQKNKKNINYA